MPDIDLRRRTIASKIVYWGCGLSGKTANLRYIHDNLEPQSRGRLASLATKTEITAYIHVLPVKFGRILGFDTTFSICAVPGQAFTNNTRRLLLKNTDGMVFVADSRQVRREANIDSLYNLDENLEHYGMSLEKMPHVIQYNKRDLSNVMEVSQMRAELNRYGVPDFEASTVTGRGILETLEAIVAAVSRDLEGRV